MCRSEKNDTVQTRFVTRTPEVAAVLPTGSTHSDRAVYSAVCRAQSNDGQTYVGVGKLNGRPVKVLRDTGCTGMIVDRALVPDVLVIPGSSGSLQMVDHTLIDVPLANVYLDSPYYKGHCRVMCVSSPVYPVIIGNVRVIGNV